MVRFNHYLKRNRYSETPSNLLIVDTESNISTDKFDCQEQTFRLGYAIHLFKQEKGWSERGFKLDSIKSFWELLDQYSYEKKKLYVFAHNMAYDYTILKLDTYISSRHLEITMRVIDSIFMVKAGNLVFLSSTNYYRNSLKELGETFGLSKMDSPDFSNVTDEKLWPYCIRDTKVLCEIIKQHIAFIVDNDLGSFKPTIAGQAFTAFRHRFMHHDLLAHSYNDILTLEKYSYRGGRCEVFKMGKFDNITCLDINSMYPFVMKTCEFPTRIVSSEIFHKEPVSEVKRILDSGNFIIADCKLDLKQPVIGYRRRIETPKNSDEPNKLLFPIGKFNQVITSPEIEYILNNPECGRILSFDSTVYYYKAKIFTEYVDFFYGLRCNTKNEAIKAMTKVMLNSLYGKLGQHQSTIPKLVTNEIEKKLYLDLMRENNTFEIEDEYSAKYVKIGDALYYVTRKDGEFSRDSIPSIASAVTAYARQILWRLIVKAGRKNVIYCDTDSLFVNKDGLANLESEINPTELGSLKIEKAGSCSIRGCKDYTFNGKVKMKGIKENAKKISENEYIQYQFQTKNTRYQNGTPDGIVKVVPIHKKLSRNYDKGIARSNGNVSPLKFDH